MNPATIAYGDIYCKKNYNTIIPTDEVPALSFSESAESVGDVAEVADNGRGEGVDHLATEQQISSECVGEVDDILEEDDEQCEPHGGAQVVVDVADAVHQLLLPTHPALDGSSSKSPTQLLPFPDHWPQNAWPS